MRETEVQIGKSGSESCGGYPHILPKQLSGLIVEKGGIGAGAAIRFSLHAFARAGGVWAEITEPVPGRVLVESILRPRPFLARRCDVELPLSEIRYVNISLPVITLGTIQELLIWYERNLCDVMLNDPRGYRVRFHVDEFVHLIKLTTRYGQEPRNRRLAIEEIRRGVINFEDGQFNVQRASELTWAKEIATVPDRICENWQILGVGKELYIKDFGGIYSHKYRVLVCGVRGSVRQALTIFPLENVGEKELRCQRWP